jgi:hypothetical protein
MPCVVFVRRKPWFPRASQGSHFIHIGDGNMRNQDNYRHHAAVLVKLAQRAATSSDKGWLVLSAEAWLDLADRFERRSERRALPLYLVGWFSRLGYLKPRSRPPRSAEVTTRTNDTGDKTQIYRIAADCENDGNRCRGHLGHDGRAVPPGRNEGIHGPTDQFGGEPLPTGSSQSISCGSRYFVGGCGAAFALVSIIIGLEMSVATAGSGAEPIVEIARKGDRLPLVPAFYQKAVNQPLDIGVPSAPTSNPEMADNCESLVSSLAHSPLRHIAGRCLS